MSRQSHEPKADPDMRLTENREGLTNIEHHHLNVDGTADLRYAENQQKLVTNNTKEPAALLDIPTKKDGTADSRFTESKEAEALGVISSDEVIEGNMIGFENSEADRTTFRSFDAEETESWINLN